MPLERAEILVTEGLEEGFIAAMHGCAIPILSAATGVNSVKFWRGVENPAKFMLLVDWESMDAHTAFRSSPSYPEFRRQFGTFSKAATMEHFHSL